MTNDKFSFLSPDNYVQCPDNPQNFNRYAYYLNNGNAWINGASFGDGLVSGLKSGLVGGLTGGLVGGVAGGISAVKDGRNFWNGDKVIVAERKYPVGSDYMQPENSFDCVPTNAKVIDHYRGGNKTARYLRDNYWIKNSDPMESGLVSDQFYDLMAEGKNASFDVLYEDFNEECIFNSFKYHDADVAIDIPGRGGYHNVLLRKMECRVHHTWGSGAHDIISYKSWIQDPATGYVNSNIFDFSLVKKICLLPVGGINLKHI